MKIQILKNIFILGLLLFGVCAQAQRVSGTVSDANGPMPGASIIVKGTTNGTTTNFDGQYTLENVAANAVLQVTFVGYGSKEVSVAGKSVVDVVLIEESDVLEQVVVVGYGVKKKSLVTGAIGSLDSKEIENSSSPRVEQVLQGRVSGVTVVSSSGSPGSGAKVRIRGAGSNGNSDPLYIVDGMKVNSMDNIAPSDIANIEVLKDAASSAIYGTEGANGVVIITTKQGKIGEQVVSFSTSLGSQSVNTKMELMNAGQFVKYMNEAGEATVVDNGIDTDWIDETFNNAFVQRYDISFSGATEKMSYYLSGSYLNQDGTVGNDNNYKRYTTRLNLKSDVKEWLEVGTNVTYTNIGNSPISEDDSFRSPINSMLLIDPLTPVIYTGALPPRAVEGVANGTAMTDSNGNVYGYPTYSNGEVINPVASSNYLYRGGIDTDKILISVYAKLKLYEGLHFTSRLGYERSNTFDARWTPIYFVTSEEQNSQVTLRDNLSRNSRWLWENFVDYTKQIGEHNVTALLGYSAEKIKNPYYSLQGSEVAQESEEFAYFDFTNRDNDRIGGSIYQKNMNSVFGRISYDYAGKYLLEGSLRYDSSSVFPKSNKGGTFPAVSAGWVISKEDFWNYDGAVDYLKLRASWGQNGSDANLAGNGDIQVFRTVDGSTPVVYQGITGVTPGDLANPSLTWERSEQTNIGVDLRALNGRLNFGADWYNKTTRDLIIPNGNIIAPPSLGQTVGAINGGTIKNTGLEFEIGWGDTTSGDFSYDINFNISTLKNEVTEVIVPAPLIGAGSPSNGDGITRFEEGYPVWYFYGYKTAGIDPATGAPIYVETDGNPGITANDKTMIGSPQPDLIYGGNIALGYKNFDFNVMLQGVAGNEIIAAYHQPSRPLTNKPVNWYTDRWTQVGDNASMPGAAHAIDAYQSDLVVEDGAYMRVKQLQLGYTFDNDILEKAHLKKLRLYISMDNYFTFTKFSGLDPEAGSFSDNSVGVDRGFYPIPREVMFGLSVDF
ncbi:SusC/RagA family TonB-linked outer membrane protein [Lutibacter sp. HS1-25]|uniref:SusC/RagA family TonB-linked outer membrane protein n=1 Tax=Lutibacter sp. HS1-25 TaxID=2485000 RepID=UPI0010122119|nr:SusC/RagA family TonB-linked outer membrane protein [Lutibacter sp. HS1-25]RXP64586.1 SusC/RagA family TonB-linked outer membrane protein [Lutibacter sp. HS1-25]